MIGPISIGRLDNGEGWFCGVIVGWFQSTGCRGTAKLIVIMPPLALPSRISHRASRDGGTRSAATTVHASRFRRARGFSLIEVALSIGVVSFAFVSLFALLPAGLTTFRQTVDTMVTSQVVGRIINEAQQTDYPDLIANPTTDRYFDDQGNEVAPADSTYTAEVTVLAPTSLPNTATPDSTSLATVTVKVANNPGHNPAPFGSGSRIPYTVHSALIAKNQ